MAMVAGLQKPLMNIFYSVVKPIIPLMEYRWAAVELPGLYSLLTSGRELRSLLSTAGRELQIKLSTSHLLGRELDFQLSTQPWTWSRVEISTLDSKIFSAARGGRELKLCSGTPLALHVRNKGITVLINIGLIDQ